MPIMMFYFFRPINKVDVARLEIEFVMGYYDVDRARYVSAYNFDRFSMSPTTSMPIGDHYGKKTNNHFNS